ncbi:MAG: hypothetical protein NC236_01495 [Mycoplasma sp.]|nr:hypothetical protein [Mycoplasma sp.]
MKIKSFVFSVTLIVPIFFATSCSNYEKVKYGPFELVKNISSDGIYIIAAKNCQYCDLYINGYSKFSGPAAMFAREKNVKLILFEKIEDIVNSSLKNIVTGTPTTILVENNEIVKKKTGILSREQLGKIMN